MAKIGSLWAKTIQEPDGTQKLKHCGKVTIDDLEFWLDIYPKFSSNPKAPSFDVYLKPAILNPTEEIGF